VSTSSIGGASEMTLLAEREGARTDLVAAAHSLRLLIVTLSVPFAITFLFSFADDRLVQQTAAGPYFDFVTTMFLAFGLVMEFPILLVGLSRVGIITSQRLTSSRRFIILGISIFAAVVTPGGDLVSPFVLGGTMYVLSAGNNVMAPTTIGVASGFERISGPPGPRPRPCPATGAGRSKPLSIGKMALPRKR
jgi:uncharacterized membrane protein AbrB (regulator of aidB expression)